MRGTPYETDRENTVNEFVGICGLGALLIVLGLLARPLVKLGFHIERDLTGRDPERLVTDLDQYVAYRRVLLIIVGVVLILVGIVVNQREAEKARTRARVEEMESRWQRELDEGRRTFGLPPDWNTTSTSSSTRTIEQTPSEAPPEGEPSD